MIYERDYNPALKCFIPDGWTKERKLIHAITIAGNWLECATLEEYPLSVRNAWHQRGKEWLDMSVEFMGDGLDFTTQDRRWILYDELDRAELFWEQSCELNKKDQRS